MKHRSFSPLEFVRKFWTDRRGATTLVFAIALVPLIGIAGFAIDIGHALQVKNSLQASTDAAVLAGALDITNGTGDPVGTAKLYSAGSGGKNTILNTPVTATVTLICFTSTSAALRRRFESERIGCPARRHRTHVFCENFRHQFYPGHDDIDRGCGGRQADATQCDAGAGRHGIHGRCGQ